MKKLITNFNFLYKFLTFYFICGPLGFIKISISSLKDIKVNKSYIYQESFGSLQIENNNKFIDKVFYNINIIYNNIINSFLVLNKTTILNTIISNNISLSFSCKNGECFSCIARCLSGKVLLKSNNLFKKKKISYILTCVSYPLTNSIIIRIN